MSNKTPTDYSDISFFCVLLEAELQELLQCSKFPLPPAWCYIWYYAWRLLHGSIACLLSYTIHLISLTILGMGTVYMSSCVAWWQNENTLTSFEEGCRVLCQHPTVSLRKTWHISVLTQRVSSICMWTFHFRNGNCICIFFLLGVKNLYTETASLTCFSSTQLQLFHHVV